MARLSVHYPPLRRSQFGGMLVEVVQEPGRRLRRVGNPSQALALDEARKLSARQRDDWEAESDRLHELHWHGELQVGVDSPKYCDCVGVRVKLTQAVTR